MLLRRFFVLILFVGLAASACQTPEPEPGEPPAPDEKPAPDDKPAGAPLLVLRQYNPASDEAHQAYLAFLADLNEAVRSAGHPETEYLAWKVRGEQAGDYGYVVGSLWRDRAAYAAVQEQDAYKNALARFERSGVQPFRDERASQFTLLNPPSEARPPVPWSRVTHLAMDAHRLDTGEQEGAFMAVLEEGSAAVARAGHPETRYDLWKSTQKQNGVDTYLFGSLWTDRDAYDAVHEHPAHKAFMERHQDAFEAALKGSVGNRYERIRLK